MERETEVTIMALLSDPIPGQRYWFRMWGGPGSGGRTYICSGVFIGNIDKTGQHVELLLPDGSVSYISKTALYTSKESACHGLRRYKVMK